MRSNLLWVLALAAAAAIGYAVVTAPPPCPDGKCPQPAPPAPKKPAPILPVPKPWGEAQSPRSAGDEVPAIDLLAMPESHRKRNITSKGLGCCTFRSAEYAAYWQNVPALYGLPEYLRDQGIPGGGIPSKQAEMVKRIAASRNLPTPGFVQYEGNDPSIIELALKTGRLPCVTWQANHMLVCVHLDASRAAILDNNDPGRVQWFGRDDFLRRWTAGGGGWVFVLTAPCPPPPPASSPRTREAGKDCLCSDQCVCGCNRGRPCPCPGSRPAQPEPAPDTPADPTGVEWSYTGVEVYTIDGRAASKRDVEDALKDDADKPHLTLIGTEDQCKAALAAAGDLAAFRVQAYRPDNWALAFGFVTDGSPSIYLQRTDGTVLLRLASADGLLAKLRRADPNYKPQNDPNGQPLSLPSMAQLKEYMPWLAALAAAAVAGYLLMQRQAPPTPPTPPAPPPAGPNPLDEVALRIGRQVLAQQAQAQQPQK